MPLDRKVIKSNDVRAPEVSRGEALVVSRYRQDNPKVALVNPEDLAMLEESYDILQTIGRLEPLPIGDLTLKAQQLEDRPDPDALVEDPDQIAAILDL